MVPEERCSSLIRFDHFVLLYSSPQNDFDFEVSFQFKNKLGRLLFSTPYIKVIIYLLYRSYLFCMPYFFDRSSVKHNTKQKISPEKTGKKKRKNWQSTFLSCYECQQYAVCISCCNQVTCVKYTSLTNYVWLAISTHSLISCL